MQGAKLQFFLEMSRISEIIYCVEGLRAVHSYLQCHNAPRSSGWASIADSDDQRRLQLPELQKADRKFRTKVFDLSSKSQNRRKVRRGSWLGRSIISDRFKGKAVLTFARRVRLPGGGQKSKKHHREEKNSQ